jgi:hypothetical protein
MVAAKFGTANLPGIMAGRLDKSARASAQQPGTVLWETKKQRDRLSSAGSTVHAHFTGRAFGSSANGESAVKGGQMICATA